MDNSRGFSTVLIELYTWLLAVFFGMVVIDILYSRSVPEAERAFSAVSDFLLIFGFFTVVAGLAAVVSSLKSTTARNFLIASLLLMLLEFLIPVILSPLIQDGQDFLLGPWLRIIPIGVASVFAFVGLHKHRGRNVAM